MRASDFINESANSYVYHVTFSNNVPKIQKQGLRPFQTSNWTTGDGERYNKEGGVFAFAHPEDAFKWAFKTNWEFKKPVSIIRLKRTDQWEKDPSADIMLQMGQGDALRSMGAVGPENFVDSFDFESFGSPVQNNQTQQEWMAGIVKKLSEHIGKVKGGYRLYSGKGKNLGTFPTKAGAEKHEREVQYFKHKK